MNVLVGCESSGIVRDEFIARGHDAWSCDIVPCERPGPHLRCDVRDALASRFWHLFIVHPDCTYTAVSGLHWNRRRPGRAAKTEEAVAFVREMMAAPVEKLCLEQPISCISTRVRKPDQIIQPWQFGHDASKATCLWLKNLPLLQPTDVLPGGRTARRANQTAGGQNRLGPSPTRKRDRARTYEGIARAMATQWG